MKGKEVEQKKIWNDRIKNNANDGGNGDGGGSGGSKQQCRSKQKAQWNNFKVYLVIVEMHQHKLLLYISIGVFRVDYILLLLFFVCYASSFVYFISIVNFAELKLMALN